MRATSPFSLLEHVRVRGERLDLHLAIWTCFANAKNQAARRERELALAN